MIKFFRHIRQQLLSENKFSKYIIYATGEIVLVVIGILIALQINTWNQDRIILEKEQVYLKSLKNEFESNWQILEYEFQTNKSNRDAARQIANFIDLKNLSDEQAGNRITNKKLSELLVQSLASAIDFKPSMAVLNEMINTGSLQDVSNSKLKTHLTAWDSNLEKIKSQERILIQDRQRSLIHILNKEVSMRMIFDDTDISKNILELAPSKRKFDNLNLLKSRAFENDLLIFIATSKFTELAFSYLKEEMETIIQLLRIEIK